MFWFTQLLNTSFVLLVLWQHLGFTVFETRLHLQPCELRFSLKSLSAGQFHPSGDMACIRTRIHTKGWRSTQASTHWTLPVSAVRWWCVVLPGPWVEGDPLECLSPVYQGPGGWIKDIRMSIWFSNQQGTPCLLFFFFFASTSWFLANHRQHLSRNRKIFWPLHRNLNTWTYFTVGSKTWWFHSPIWAPYVSQATESFLPASPWTVTAIVAVLMGWELTGPSEAGEKLSSQFHFAQTPASEQGVTVALNTLHSHLFGFESTGWSASYETHQLAKLHEDDLVPHPKKERWLSLSVLLLEIQCEKGVPWSEEHTLTFAQATLSTWTSVFLLSLSRSLSCRRLFFF